MHLAVASKQDRTVSFYRLMFIANHVTISIVTSNAGANMHDPSPESSDELKSLSLHQLKYDILLIEGLLLQNHNTMKCITLHFC